MCSITDIPISDIQKFLNQNKAVYNVDNAYDVARKLLFSKKVNFSTYNDSIIEWSIAYNLLESNVDIPSYSIEEINNLTVYEREKLSKLLTLKSTLSVHIINVLRYMNKLKISNMKNSICNELTIRRAIKNNGEKILYMDISELENIYGSNAFNLEYLEDTWDNLSITRKGYPINIIGILGHVLRKNKFESAEKDSKMTPAEIEKYYGNNRWRPNWNPSWDYVKCLIRIFQSEPKTRLNFKNMVSDDDLGV